jgi:hypothetical protein
LINKIFYGGFFMDFIRLYLSDSFEFYQVVNEDEDICYLLLHDYNRPSKIEDFEGRILDDDFESRENFISVKCLYLASDFNDKYLDKVAHHVDCLLSFKPSCDYYISVAHVSEELDYYLPNGMHGIIDYLNKHFGCSLNSTNVDFNKLLQT